MKVLVHLYWCCAGFVWAISPTAGFPLADSLPLLNGVEEKFILYWGDVQVVLRADKQYCAEVTVAPLAFRQMLLHPPRLWNGRALEEKVAFRLEGFPVVATRGTADYEAQLEALYERFAPKATNECRLLLTDLVLPAQRQGNVVFLIKSPADSAMEMSLLAERYGHFWLDSQLLVTVIWGLRRHETTQRDFFTPQEALQILYQQPSMVWQPYATPQPVYAEVRIIEADGVQQMLRVFLENAEAYGPFARRITLYRFLLRPGSQVVLRLLSDRYDRLFEHRLRLVGEQDPRLALRRYRDTHRVRLTWGPIQHVWQALYLSCWEVGDATCLSGDLPEPVPLTLAQTLLPELLNTRPVLWIDGVCLPDLSFRIAIDDQEVHVLPEEAMPSVALPSSEEPRMRVVRLYHLAAAGYDLSGIALRINAVATKVLPSLPSGPPLSALVLYQPVVRADSVEIIFDLPDSAVVSLVLSAETGDAVHRVNSLYSAGRHHIALSREIFVPPGSYTVELATPFGTVWQTFEI